MIDGASTTVVIGVALSLVLVVRAVRSHRRSPRALALMALAWLAIIVGLALTIDHVRT